MPNPEELITCAKVGAQAVEEFAPGIVKAVQAELPEIFGGGGAVAEAAASELSDRLLVMPPQAPMGEMIRSVLATGDSGAIGSLRNYFHLPTEARTLLNPGDVSHLTGLLKEGSPGSLTEFKSTMGLLGDLGKQATPDLTSAQVLRAAREAGVAGDRPWVGRSVNLGFGDTKKFF